MAVTLEINQGVGPVSGVPSGTRAVSPAATTTYTLTARSAAGQVATRQVTVTVEEPIRWVDRYTPADRLYAITYANGRFVAVGGKGLIVTSTDGINWEDKTSSVIGGSIRELNAITYSGGQFVAIGTNTIVTSPDGVVWTQRATAFSPLFNVPISGISCGVSVYDPDVPLYCAVGGNGGFIASSNDAINWTVRANGILPAGNYLYSVVVTPYYIAVGGDGAIFTGGFPWSIGWQAVDLPNISTRSWQNLIRAAGMTFAIAPGEMKFVSNSAVPLDIDWPLDFPAGVGGEILAVSSDSVSSDPLYLVARNGGAFNQSNLYVCAITDIVDFYIAPLSFVEEPLGQSVKIGAAAFGNGICVAVGDVILVRSFT